MQTNAGAHGIAEAESADIALTDVRLTDAITQHIAGNDGIMEKVVKSSSSQK